MATFAFDFRMFIVVDDSGNFVTGRQYPQLLRVEANVHEGRLRLSCGDRAETVEADLRSVKGPPQKIR